MLVISLINLIKMLVLTYILGILTFVIIVFLISRKL